MDQRRCIALMAVSAATQAPEDARKTAIRALTSFSQTRFPHSAEQEAELQALLHSFEKLAFYGETAQAIVEEIHKAIERVSHELERVRSIASDGARGDDA